MRKDCWGAHAEATGAPVIEGLGSVAAPQPAAPSCERQLDSGTAPPARKKPKRKDARKQVLLHVNNICTLFVPFVHLIRIKKMQEEEQVKDAKAFMKWFDGTDPKTFEDMADEGARLEDELRAAANVQIAFADKGEYSSDTSTPPTTATSGSEA